MIAAALTSIAIWVMAVLWIAGLLFIGLGRRVEILFAVFGLTTLAVATTLIWS